MISRRSALLLAPLGVLLGACEQLGIKAKITSTRTENGKTTVKVREAKNWHEFEEAMGEVATDFSDFAKKVGAVTSELVHQLVDTPPPGQVTLSTLDPSLASFENDLRYDYLYVARQKPNPEYDFRYVQIGMPAYDAFFRASAELYSTAYQLVETGRHIHLAAARAQDQSPDGAVDAGRKKLPKAAVETALAALSSAEAPEVAESAKQLHALWGSALALGVKLGGKAAETAQTGVALIASAPAQILNPKLVLHLKLIVKGLDESVGLVKDTAKLLGELI